MDPGWPTATAVAVKDKKILSVGSLEDLYPWIENNQYEIVDYSEQSQQRIVTANGSPARRFPVYSIMDSVTDTDIEIYG